MIAGRRLSASRLGPTVCTDCRSLITGLTTFTNPFTKEVTIWDGYSQKDRRGLS